MEAEVNSKNAENVQTALQNRVDFREDSAWIGR